MYPTITSRYLVSTRTLAPSLLNPQNTFLVEFADRGSSGTDCGSHHRVRQGPLDLVSIDNVVTTRFEHDSLIDELRVWLQVYSSALRFDRLRSRRGTLLHRKANEKAIVFKTQYARRSNVNLKLSILSRWSML